MFNGYNEATPIFTDCDHERAKKHSNVGKWPQAGHGAGLQPHISNQSEYFKQFLNYPNVLPAKCNCAECYSCPENQADPSRHRPWYGDTSKLPDYHQWENVGLPEEKSCALEESGAVSSRYLQENGEKSSFHRPYAPPRQSGVIASAKIAETKEMTASQEILLLGQNKTRQPGHYGNGCYETSNKKETPSVSDSNCVSDFCERNERFSNSSTYASNQNALLHQVPSNAIQNRVPSIGHRPFKETSESFLDQNFHDPAGKVLSSFDENRSCRNVYQPTESKTMTNDLQNGHAKHLYPDPKLGHYADYSAYSSAKRDYLVPCYDAESQKLQYYNKKTELLGRNYLPEPMKKNGPTVYGDTKRDCMMSSNVHEQYYGTQKFWEVTNQKLNSCGIFPSDKRSRVEVKTSSTGEPSDCAQRNDGKSNQPVPRVPTYATAYPADPNGLRCAEKDYVHPFYYQSNPAYKSLRRPDYPCPRYNAQSRYDYPHAFQNSAQYNLKSYQPPSACAGIDQYLPHVNNNFVYDSPYQQPSIHAKTIPQPYYDSTRPDLQMQQHYPPDFGTDLLSRKPAAKPADLASRSAGNKISPLRLLRKKKPSLGNETEGVIPERNSDAAPQISDGAQVLDVRKFWATFTDQEDDDNGSALQQPQMIVLNYENIGPEQEELLRLCDGQTVHVDNTGVLTITESISEKPGEQSRSRPIERPPDRNANGHVASIPAEGADLRTKCSGPDVAQNIPPTPLELPVIVESESVTERPVPKPKKGEILDKWTEKKFDFVKKAEEKKAMKNEEEIKKIFESKLYKHIAFGGRANSVPKIDEVPVPKAKESKDEVQKAQTKETVVESNESLSNGEDSVEESEASALSKLPTSEYRKNKFLDYSGAETVLKDSRKIVENEISEKVKPAQELEPTRTIDLSEPEPEKLNVRKVSTNLEPEKLHSQEPSENLEPKEPITRQMSTNLEPVESASLEPSVNLEPKDLVTRRMSLNLEPKDLVSEEPSANVEAKELVSWEPSANLELKSHGDENGNVQEPRERPADLEHKEPVPREPLANVQRTTDLVTQDELEEISRKISRISFDSPESEENVKKSKKKTKKISDQENGSSTKEECGMNLSVNPKLKFSIQKLQDLKMSFKILNDSNTRENIGLRDSADDKDLTIDKSAPETTDSRLKSDENFRDVIESGSNDKNVEKIVRRSKKKKVKSKTKKMRLQETETEEKSFIREELILDLSNKEAKNREGFRVHEIVDSAKIKLTLKRETIASEKENVDRFKSRKRASSFLKRKLKRCDNPQKLEYEESEADQTLDSENAQSKCEKIEISPDPNEKEPNYSISSGFFDRPCLFKSDEPETVPASEDLDSEAINLTKPEDDKKMEEIVADEVETTKRSDRNDESVPKLEENMADANGSEATAQTVPLPFNEMSAPCEVEGRRTVIRNFLEEDLHFSEEIGKNLISLDSSPKELQIDEEKKDEVTTEEVIESKKSDVEFEEIDRSDFPDLEKVEKDAREMPPLEDRTLEVSEKVTLEEELMLSSDEEIEPEVSKPVEQEQEPVPDLPDYSLIESQLVEIFRHSSDDEKEKEEKIEIEKENANEEKQEISASNDKNELDEVQVEQFEKGNSFKPDIDTGTEMALLLLSDSENMVEESKDECEKSSCDCEETYISNELKDDAEKSESLPVLEQVTDRNNEVEADLELRAKSTELFVEGENAEPTTELIETDYRDEASTEMKDDWEKFPCESEEKSETTSHFEFDERINLSNVPDSEKSSREGGQSLGETSALNDRISEPPDSEAPLESLEFNEEATLIQTEVEESVEESHPLNGDQIDEEAVQNQEKENSASTETISEEVIEKSKVPTETENPLNAGKPKPLCTKESEYQSIIPAIKKRRTGRCQSLSREPDITQRKIKASSLPPDMKFDLPKKVNNSEMPISDIPLPKGDPPIENCFDFVQYFKRSESKETEKVVELESAKLNPDTKDLEQVPSDGKAENDPVEEVPKESEEKQSRCSSPTLSDVSSESAFSGLEIFENIRSPFVSSEFHRFRNPSPPCVEENFEDKFDISKPGEFLKHPRLDFIQREMKLRNPSPPSLKFSTDSPFSTESKTDSDGFSISKNSEEAETSKENNFLDVEMPRENGFEVETSKDDSCAEESSSPVSYSRFVTSPEKVSREIFDFSSPGTPPAPTETPPEPSETPPEPTETPPEPTETPPAPAENSPKFAVPSPLRSENEEPKTFPVITEKESEENVECDSKNAEPIEIECYGNSLMTFEDAILVEEGLYECEEPEVDNSLPVTVDEVEEEKVSDDKFHDVMQNCLENAKKFLNVGHYKLLSCSVDDLLEIGNSETTKVVSEDHISRDVLLTSIGDSAKDELPLGENVPPSDLSVDFVPSFGINSSRDDLCPEILPVDNWPYLEEEVPSSPIKSKSDDPDVSSPRLEDVPISENPISLYDPLKNLPESQNVIPFYLGDKKFFFQKRETDENGNSVSTEFNGFRRRSLVAEIQSELVSVRRRKTVDGIARRKVFEGKSADFKDAERKKSDADEGIRKISSKRETVKKDGERKINTESTPVKRMLKDSENGFLSRKWQPKVVLSRISDKELREKKRARESKSEKSEAPKKKRTNSDGKRNGEIPSEKKVEDSAIVLKIDVEKLRLDDTVFAQKDSSKVPNGFSKPGKRKRSDELDEKISDTSVENASENRRKKPRFRNLHSKNKLSGSDSDEAKSLSSKKESERTEVKARDKTDVSEKHDPEPRGKTSTDSRPARSKGEESRESVNAQISVPEAKNVKKPVAETPKRSSKSDSSKSSARNTQEKHAKKDYSQISEDKPKQVSAEDVKSKKVRKDAKEDSPRDEGNKKVSEPSKSISDDSSKNITRDRSKKKKSEEKTGEDWICQVCGFKDAAERSLHIQTHAFHCQSCHLAFKTEPYFIEHLTKKHKDIKSQHHCLLCELSFDTEDEHRKHLDSREHKHLESVEKNTINTLLTLLTGQSCPILGPVENKPEWLPNMAGTVHFYHQATPLSLALQYLKMRHDNSSSRSRRPSDNHTPSIT